MEADWSMTSSWKPPRTPSANWTSTGPPSPVRTPPRSSPPQARLPLLHIKDGTLEKDAPHVAVGSGKLDMPAIIGAADPNVLEWLMVELDNCATDMTEAVRQSYAYLTGQGLGAGNK